MGGHEETWLVCYDVADPRRLQRVLRRVSRDAMRIQYSVYLFRGSRRRRERLVADLERLIIAAEDDVRLYSVPARAEPVFGGIVETGSAEGIYLHGGIVGQFWKMGYS